MKQGQQSRISMLKEQRNVRKYLAVAACMIAVLTAALVFWSLRISGFTLEETATETSASETDATETDGEEETGTSTTNGTSSKVRASLKSSGTEEYYFADSTALATAAANQNESYIVYTIIDGAYYVVSAEDALVPCTYLGDDYDTGDLATATTNEDMYCWKDSSGNLVFKCTTDSSDNAFDDYRWTLSGTAEDSSNGTGEYTLYNSENAVYIAPQDVGVGETLETTDTISSDYQIDGTDTTVLVFEITCTTASSEFWVELYDTERVYTYNASSTTSCAFITTSTNNCWYFPNYNLTEWKDTDGNTAESIGDSLEKSGSDITPTVGVTYTVSIIRTDSNDTASYTINYRGSDGSSLTYTADKTALSSANVYARIYNRDGAYEISRIYATAKDTEIDTSTASTDDLTLKGVTTDITAGETITVDDVPYATQTGRLTLTGDFDITYSFYNYGSNSTSGTYSTDGKHNNFVLMLQDSDGYVYVEPSFSAGVEGSDASLTTNEVATPSTWTGWAGIMNSGGVASDGKYNICYAHVVRQKNTVTVTLTVKRNAGNGETAWSEYEATVVYGEDFKDLTIYLTAVNANIMNLKIENNSTSYDVTGYDSYSAVGTWETNLTLTGSSTGSISLATATSKFLDSVTLAADSTSAMSFVKSGPGNTVFYLAKVREYTVFFDGQNGGSSDALQGVIYYRGAGQITKTTSVDATGEEFTVEVPNLTYTTYNSNYVPYTLRGWVNIYTGAYYDIDSYEGESIIVSANNTVFYADWMIEDYDIGQSNSNTVTVPDTSNYIKSYLFDYNDLLNLYSVSLDTDTTEASDSVGFITSLSGGSHSERWLSNSSTGVLTGVSNILDTSLDFLFLGSGRVGSLAYVDGRSSDRNKSSTVEGNANDYYLGKVTSGILGSGTVTTSNNTLLKVLFAKDNTLETLTDEQTYEDAILGKTYVGEACNLFRYNEDTGYYYYDSTKNAAAYNQSAKTFYVYNYTEMTAASNGENENKSDFLPFNYSAGSATYDVYTVNYWFGMQTDINFYLPEESNADGTGVVNQSAFGDDMVFKFSGDDDVWVCVDDVLVLDLGGMHGAVYGEINFSTGVITVGQSGATKTTDSETETISVTGATGVTTSNAAFSEGTHTLTVYYLERGASQSNMAIYLNLSPVYTVQMTKVGESSEKLGGVTFNLYSSTTFTEEYLVAGDIETDSNGVLTINELDPLKTYYLVETSAAEGYPLTSRYIKIYVDSDGTATITVCSSDGTELETNTSAVDTSTTVSGGRYLLSTLSVTETTDSTYGDYCIVAFTYANYLEYELPATGSTGIQPYLLAGETLILIAGAGLILIALYQAARLRRMRAAGNRGYGREKSEDRRRCRGARDRPDNAIGMYTRTGGAYGCARTNRCTGGEYGCARTNRCTGGEYSCARTNRCTGVTYSCQNGGERARGANPVHDSFTRKRATGPGKREQAAASGWISEEIYGAVAKRQPHRIFRRLITINVTRWNRC